MQIFTTEKTVPVSLFGQNLEHTRSCIAGGLAAQMLRNRKFAGKPSRSGLAAHWESTGEKQVFFEMFCGNDFCRHAAESAMFRQNECNTQYIENFEPHAFAGIKQNGLVLRENTEYLFRAAFRSPNGDSCKVMVFLSGADELVFEVKGPEWQVFEGGFRVQRKQDHAECRILIESSRVIAVGMVSLLPADHFHGMRRDVVENLRKIGTSIIRWPGGNFAGEYRWRDGLLDRDVRAPLQSATEIETQPYTEGYDSNELNTDDIAALCREIGAEPYFTLNPVWDSEEECAAWIEYCNGSASTPGGKLRAERGHAEPYRVRLWSLGNEMGFLHMEGDKEPAVYARKAGALAKKLLEKDPSITFVSSGVYPEPAWVSGAAIPMHDVAPVSALHTYAFPSLYDFTNAERSRRTVRKILELPEHFFDKIKEFCSQLPKEHKIAYDEWNIWYAWYRDPGTAGGLCIYRTLKGFLENFEAWQIALVCYFQPVNEGAIAVSPEESHLTAIGQAMQVFSRHKGGRICTFEGQPETSVFTVDSCGKYCFSAANTDLDRPLVIHLPEKTWKGEILTAKQFWSNSVFESAEAKVAADGTVELPPLSMISVTC